jgi:cytochrome subunit of sulfide dehydrogenase
MLLLRAFIFVFNYFLMFHRHLPLALMLGAALPAAAKDSPIATGKMMGNTCASCHGTHGKSYDEYMPSLAGIDRLQLLRAMTDYREDRRVSVVMNRIAKGYNDAEIAAIADYFSKIK